MVLIPGLPDDLARECLVRVCCSQFWYISRVCKAWNYEVKSNQFYLIRKKTCNTQKLIFVPTLTQTKNPIRLTLLDPETGIWSCLPPIPDRLRMGRPLLSCQVLGCNFSIFVLLLLDADYILERFGFSVYVFDIFTSTWRRGASLSGLHPVAEGCSFDGDHMMYVLCTSDPQSLHYGPVKSKWIISYDIEKDKWNICSECDGGARAIFHRGKIHVEFQEKLGLRLMTSWRNFDVTTRQWKLSQEHFLRTSLLPLGDYNGEWYGCGWDGNLVALRDSGCKAIAKLPAQGNNASMFCVTSWESNLVVISSDKHVWMQGNNVYVLDLKNHHWTRIGALGELNCIRSASSVEI